MLLLNRQNRRTKLSALGTSVNARTVAGGCSRRICEGEAAAGSGVGASCQRNAVPAKRCEPRLLLRPRRRRLELEVEVRPGRVAGRARRGRPAGRP